MKYVYLVVSTSIDGTGEKHIESVWFNKETADQVAKDMDGEDQFYTVDVVTEPVLDSVTGPQKLWPDDDTIDSSTSDTAETEMENENFDGLILVMLGNVEVDVSEADARYLLSQDDYARHLDRIYQRPPKSVNPFEHSPKECREYLNDWWHRRAPTTKSA